MSPAPSLRALVSELARAYPPRRDGVDRIDEELFLRDLSDVPVPALADAVRTILRTSRDWPPTVGDVRELAAEQTLGIPDEREAMRQVDARIAWARTGAGGDPPALHPLAREAVDHVGGWHSVRVSDRPEVVRGQMMRYYREARQRLLRDAAAADMSGLQQPPALS